jgi:hypothetical protein
VYGKTGAAAGRAARAGGVADSGDALSGLSGGRPSWDTGPADVVRIHPDASVTPLDGRMPKAQPNYLGAVATGVEVGGQVLERSSRQMGEPVDQNRDMKLEDITVIAADLVPGVAGYEGRPASIAGSPGGGTPSARTASRSSLPRRIAHLRKSGS